jgi:UDP-glucose:(glucosyl)LPS alpha-1,2-glucosyltransferase
LATRTLRKHRLSVAPRIAVVLPPREGFSPFAVGAIGLLVHRLTTPEDAVIGAPLGDAPFADRRFLPAKPVWWPPAGPGRYAASVARVLRRLGPDLIEVQNRPEIALRLARRFQRTPIALFLHNDPQAMRGARTPLERERLLARMQIVCVSDYLRSRFLQGVRTRADVAVLPNCIDPAQIPPSPAARDPLILFAGRVVADKGADAFVSACAEILPRLPGWRAEMIGADRFSADSPETPFLERLRPAASAAGVRMLGHLPHRAVLEAMARAAIVVVPSRWQEPFGMTALEALATGAALIVSPRPGLLEVVGDAAVTAEPDQPGALAAALLHLAGDPALRAHLSEQAHARAALFDAGIARARLAELRGRLLGGR